MEDGRYAKVVDINNIGFAAEDKVQGRMSTVSEANGLPSPPFPTHAEEEGCTVGMSSAVRQTCFTVQSRHQWCQDAGAQAQQKLGEDRRAEAG